MVEGYLCNHFFGSICRDISFCFFLITVKKKKDQIHCDSMLKHEKVQGRGENLLQVLYACKYTVCAVTFFYTMTFNKKMKAFPWSCWPQWFCCLGSSRVQSCSLLPLSVLCDISRYSGEGYICRWCFSHCCISRWTMTHLVGLLLLSRIRIKKRQNSWWYELMPNILPENATHDISYYSFWLGSWKH